VQRLSGILLILLLMTATADLLKTWKQYHWDMIQEEYYRQQTEMLQQCLTS